MDVKLIQLRCTNLSDVTLPSVSNCQNCNLFLTLTLSHPQEITIFLLGYFCVRGKFTAKKASCGYMHYDKIRAPLECSC